MPPFPSLMTCRRDGFGVPPVFLYFLSNCFRGGFDTAFIMRTEGLNNPSRRRRKPDLSMTGTEEVDMRKKGLAAVAAVGPRSRGLLCHRLFLAGKRKGI